MDESQENNDLSKKIKIDDEFLGYLTDTTEEIGKKFHSEFVETEERFTKKITRILIDEFKFLPKNIVAGVSLETDRTKFQPDLVILDESTQTPVLIVEYQVLEKTAESSRRQLKKILENSHVKYGIIFDGKKSDFYQLSNQVLIPIASLPTKDQILEKTVPITVDQEVAESIAENMLAILRRQGIFESEAVLIALQILFIKSYDELILNGRNFNSSEFKKGNIKRVFENVWRELTNNHQVKYEHSLNRLSQETILNLSKFIENFSIKTSDFSSLFSALIANLRYRSTIRTPFHLFENMLNLANVSPHGKTKIIVSGTGESLQNFITFTNEKLDFDKNQLQNYFENNVEFSIQDSQIFEIAQLYAILSGYQINVENENIITDNHDIGANLFDSIVLDTLLINKMPKYEAKKLVEFSDFHDALLSHLIDLLNIGGRIVAILPKTYLFQRKSAKNSFLNQVDLKAVIEIPIMGDSFGIYNCALVVLEKTLPEESKPTFMAQYSTTKRTFYDPYDEKKIEKIIRKYQEYEITGKLETQNDFGFLVDKQELDEDWTVSRKLPSLKEKISKIKHPKQIKNIIRIISGRRIKLPHNEQRQIPYILISDFDDFYQRKLSQKSKPKIPPNIDPDQLTREGDILLSRSGTIGKVAIVPKEYEGQLVSPGIAILRLRQSDILPQLIKTELEKETTQDQFNSYAQSTFNYYLTNQSIGNITINIPTHEEQKKLSHKINTIEAKIREYHDEIKHLETKLKEIQEE